MDQEDDNISNRKSLVWCDRIQYNTIQCIALSVNMKHYFSIIILFTLISMTLFVCRLIPSCDSYSSFILFCTLGFVTHSSDLKSINQICIAR